jgi:hypothetical protein
MSAQEKYFVSGSGIIRLGNGSVDVDGVLIQYVDGDPVVTILCLNSDNKEFLLERAREICRMLGK